MDVAHERAEEAGHLRRCFNDLVCVLALPAAWSGNDPSRIAATLADGLVRVLGLDLAYVRLNAATLQPPVEIARVMRSRAADAQRVSQRLEALGEDPRKWPAVIPNPIGEGELSLAAVALGLRGDVGLIVAGSCRADFPKKTDRLLLSVAANQAAIGLQEARLLSEQKRLADELEQRVAQRTTALAAANEELKREVAERRRADQALDRARAELAYVSRVTSLGVLTASIAHEINQPLAGIMTNASTCLQMLAADRPNVDGARETARRTIRDAGRASDVIARLRTLFAKKGSAREPVDLNQATREVIALSAGELRSSGVILRTELADGLPAVIGDRIQLQQVILNLVLNAMESMLCVGDRPRQMVIRTEPETGDRVRLSIQDAGTGFDPRNAQKLFDAFYTSKAGGMGIGLSVSRSIVESHDGRLWAMAREDGLGSTFAFSLPRGTLPHTPANQS
jgi:signal transduction histidine kinase